MNCKPLLTLLFRVTHKNLRKYLNLSHCRCLAVREALEVVVVDPLVVGEVLGLQVAVALCVGLAVLEMLGLWQ